MLEADYMWALKDTSATPAGGQPDQHLGRESLRLRWMNSEPRPVYADAAECLGDSSSLREGLATQRMRGERGRATTYWSRHSLLWRISDARIKRHTSASNNTHCRREFQMTPAKDEVHPWKVLIHSLDMRRFKRRPRKHADVLQDLSAERSADEGES